MTIKNLTKKIKISENQMEVNENLPLREIHREIKKTLFNSSRKSKKSRDGFPL